MNSKRFEYTNKDIPYLKKDIFMRTFFAVLLLIVFVWQFVSAIQIAISSYLSIINLSATILVFVCTFMLSFISLLYTFKNFRIIAAIKMNGRCVSSVQILIKTNKKSFIWLYNFVVQILTLATSLVLICTLVYSFLQATYLSSISFYLPFLLMVCISGFNSIYHIKHEIYIQNSVQEYYNA